MTERSHPNAHYRWLPAEAGRTLSLLQRAALLQVELASAQIVSMLSFFSKFWSDGIFEISFLAVKTDRKTLVVS